MLGMIAAEPASARELLRGLGALAREHADGWGLALRGDGGWQVHRSTECAASCARYDELAARARARIAIAHVRKMTVGGRAIANTHPFRRGELVFAHNGTIRDVAALAARTAPEHLARVEGETDSERLLAFVLTHVDEAGDVARGIAAAVRALHALDPGTATFLVSCGERLYAHRLGRSLYAREQDGVSMIASEPLTRESWREVPERALVVLEAPLPSTRPLAA